MECLLVNSNISSLPTEKAILLRQACSRSFMISSGLSVINRPLLCKHLKCHVQHHWLQFPVWTCQGWINKCGAPVQKNVVGPGLPKSQQMTHLHKNCEIKYNRLKILIRLSYPHVQKLCIVKWVVLNLTSLFLVILIMLVLDLITNIEQNCCVHVRRPPFSQACTHIT